jgi:hypothetical protein
MFTKAFEKSDNIQYFVLDGLIFHCISIKIYENGKAVPVTGRGGPLGCERSRLSHFPDNPLTDGDEVTSLTRRSPFTPQEDSWYSVLLEAESTPRAIVRMDGVGHRI